MKTIIVFNNQKIPVFYTEASKKALSLLKIALEAKWNNGKRAVKTCLENLISIEIEGTEAILHSRRESDTLALSLY
ncbi:3-dehydroquinate dehydratase [Paenibacillus chitinolyticus]|uniref:3-dehydroquinate dehydratase n=1 Tax=Paenibacillus chitinolyticus TaxID=79263 RepID=A0A410WVT7_9BACL|nr:MULTISPECIES: hypothetical protein [Paenibacillus]EGL16097.1 hypothetical protein HMPREF9413_0026 [Paenibacillus sp. HGF7]EPD80936.1 hypothetical protein HMPREF1207_04693 [Paenibacillus sp. HGH0039]MBV6714800.1 3-dehydroquinate dehydratase [Paenibacillus chitinolyticus]MCY9589219.1 3-dehydroquinate dehydratase [Paenibacillus chitinolyticus]MCY9594292.1 3-dehydroquinate dehydratase [Paenibacillus chitinolyticus]